MSKHQYKIEIKGEGTREHILHSLLTLVQTLQFTDDIELNKRGKHEWEDEVLMTYIIPED